MDYQKWAQEIAQKIKIKELAEAGITLSYPSSVWR